MQRFRTLGAVVGCWLPVVCLMGQSARAQAPASVLFPNAPILSEPCAGKVYFFGEVGVDPTGSNQEKGIDFSWSPVEGADRYELVIEPPEGADPTAFPDGSWPWPRDPIPSSEASQVHLPLTDYNNPQIYDGVYTWKVRAWHGAESGAFSVSRPFEVLKDLPRSGDVNEDTRIDETDLFRIAKAWQEAATPIEPEDLNRDGRIDEADLAAFLEEQRGRRDRPVLPAPEVIHPATGSTWNWLDLYGWHTEGIPLLRWNRVEGAARHDVQTRGYGHANPQHNQLQYGPSAWTVAYEGKEGLTFPWALYRGQWSQRVRCRGRDGRVGPWSEWVFFTIE